MSDDPFAEPTDSDRTVMRPRPGGKATTQPPPRPAAATAAAPAGPVPTVGANKLLAAAAPLLAAIIRIAGGRGRGPDVEQLRRGMVDAVREFESNALATGLDTRSLRAARYALCATVDDVVLSTPWGAASSWPQQTLTSMFHNEVTGGERFFEILEQMQRELSRHAEVVELMYLCTSLGFEGRYRVMPRGVAALTELRAGIYRAIRTRRGEFERELSPNWRGLETGYKPLGQRVPLWAIGLATVFVACLIYLGFNFALAGTSDVAFAEITGLPPNGPVQVPRVAAAPPPPPPPAIVSDNHAATKLHQFLAPEIKAGLVTVFEDAQSVTVRLAGKAMFASGTANLAPSYGNLLQRIGAALQDEPGRVLVNGYTDNQPIHTMRFPSNFDLSQARAQAVATLLAAHLTDPKRVVAQGKGAADPIADNATADGRQQNRRTEIVLVRTGEAP
ncbi:MAG: type VI secretion system protein TssL, long form [Rhodospirillales bacterium]